MAEKNIVSALLYPDAQVEGADIQRQQMLADMLRAQSFQPQQDQVINGLLMPSSNIAGLSRLGQGLIANNIDKGLQDRQTALNQKMADALRTRLDKFKTPQAGLTSMPADYGMGGGSGMSIGGVSGTSTPGQNQSPIDEFDIAALASVNPDLAKAYIKNNIELPEAVRTMDLTGQNRLLAGQLATAKGKKEAMYDQAPGTMATDLLTGKQKYLPKVSEGISLQNGRASVIPGYADSNAAIQGAQTEAQERMKAKYDPMTYTPAGSANPVLSTRGKVLSGEGYAGGSSAAAANGQLEILQKELLKPGNTPEDIAAIQREIARLQGSGGIPVQSEAEKQRLVKTAEADVVRDTEKQKAAKMYGQMRMGVNRAIELLQRDPTHSGIGSLVDTGLGAFGISTNGANVASQLDTLSGWLTANVPRMEGPQSDRDVANYRIMAGTVGDRTKPIEVRMSAAQELKSLQDKYADLNGYAKPTENSSNIVDQLPKSAPVGSRVRDTVTGKIMRFDGSKWRDE